MMSLLWASDTFKGCCFLITWADFFFIGATVLIGYMNSSIPWLFYRQIRILDLKNGVNLP